MTRQEAKELTTKYSKEQLEGYLKHYDVMKAFGEGGDVGIHKSKGEWVYIKLPGFLKYSGYRIIKKDPLQEAIDSVEKYLINNDFFGSKEVQILLDHAKKTKDNEKY